MFLYSLVIYPFIILLLLVLMKSNNLNLILLLERFILYYAIALTSTLILKKFNDSFVILKNKTIIRAINIFGTIILIILFFRSSDEYNIYYWITTGFLIPLSTFINYRNGDKI